MKTHFLSAAIATALIATLPATTLAATSPTRAAPLVDVRGVDHVGINVPDVEAASRFFTDMFGFVPVTEMRDIPVDAAFKKTFHMHDDAKVKSIRMLRAGDGANIELFQYDSPHAVVQEPYYDDIGASHIALYTDDIDKAVAALRAKGVTVLTDPIRMTQGPASGNAWVYFLTPWGSKMELVSYPNGQAGEQTAGVHLWKAPRQATSEAMSQAAAEKVIRTYVTMLNDPDAASRARTIDATYTDDTVFNDPEGFIQGKAELNTLVGNLQSAHKGSMFRINGPIVVQHGTARVPWTYGPASAPKTIIGEDIVTLVDGKVASTVVFLLSVPH
ncbi:VOC family protein [Luteibacter sp. CQ10]|uniref:VOC family protein n=1 Tax=Luteibacter sp. CQ10 TaxID=2805821 RepID=UPI0034A0FE4A